MSTSKTYQQSLADAGSETRPPMLERVPKLQTTEDLQGDALLHYDAKMELMNLILLSFPNDIYNYVDACISAKNMWKRVERLMRGTIQNKVDRETRFTNEFDQFVAEPGEARFSVYNRFAYDVHHNLKISLTSAMLLLARAITQIFSTQTNNRLRTLSNTRNQAIIQGDKGSNAPNETGNVQRTLRTSSSRNTSTIQCYNCHGKGHYARNCPKPRVWDSKYFMEQMLLAKQDEARVILTDEQNDFLFVDASRMEEIKELNANICLMTRIQPADNTSDAGPSYDSAFISEVQSSSNNENEEQMYSTHTKIMNSTIGDDQIDSNIIFDSPNGNVNSGSIEKDTHVPDLYIIRDLEKQRDKLDLDVKDYKRQNEELQKNHSILKRQMSENKDKYHDTILDLEAKLKKNVDLILKLGNSLQGMFMLGPKPLSVYDQQLKHGLGYPNPYTLKQAISQCPKLYLASSLGNSEISLNVRDTEDTLDDASKSQQKVYEKMNDPIAVANKQNCWTIDYAQINALYKDFVP
ncbi:retrovirus-related pol polyprotein from transposon TNT 1-94 [Tanacetum coccineum]|uniref:Retrovirus-related pol polyprotein from transposon TNT 1-94 n=1 Tax=Tanacetum coccineum TaxID=301880 RepID=A0ABQ5I6T3_9ASTR